MLSSLNFTGFFVYHSYKRDIFPLDFVFFYSWWTKNLFSFRRISTFHLVCERIQFPQDSALRLSKHRHLSSSPLSFLFIRYNKHTPNLPRVQRVTESHTFTFPPVLTEKSLEEYVSSFWFYFTKFDDRGLRNGHRQRRKSSKIKLKVMF